MRPRPKAGRWICPKFRRVLVDYIGQCEYPGCHYVITPFNPLDWSHLNAKKMGGGSTDDRPSNLQCLCRLHHMLYERNKRTQRPILEAALKARPDWLVEDLQAKFDEVYR